MTYIINEYQTTGDSTAIVTPVTQTDYTEAQAQFLEKCAAACRSQVEEHTITWQRSDGRQVDFFCHHYIVPAPEPEPEPEVNE